MKQYAATDELFSLLAGVCGSDSPSMKSWRAAVTASYEMRRQAAAKSLGLSLDATWLEIMERRRQLIPNGSADVRLPETAPPGTKEADERSDRLEQTVS